MQAIERPPMHVSAHWSVDATGRASVRPSARPQAVVSGPLLEALSELCSNYVGIRMHINPWCAPGGLTGGLWARQSWLGWVLKPGTDLHTHACMHARMHAHTGVGIAEGGMVTI